MLDIDNVEKWIDDPRGTLTWVSKGAFETFTNIIASWRSISIGKDEPDPETIGKNQISSFSSGMHSGTQKVKGSRRQGI